MRTGTLGIIRNGYGGIAGIGEADPRFYRLLKCLLDLQAAPVQAFLIKASAKIGAQPRVEWLFH